MNETGENSGSEEERKIILQNIYKSFDELLVKYDTLPQNTEFTAGLHDMTEWTRLHKEATVDQIRSIISKLKNDLDPDNFKSRLSSILKSRMLKFGDETYKQLENIINNA